MPFLREKSAKFFRWISDNRRHVVCACFSFVFLFIAARPVQALGPVVVAAAGYAAVKSGAAAAGGNFMGSFVLLLIANILQVIVMVLGQLMLGLVSILVSVAQYNDFVNAAVVTNGWTIVRDVTNMFFILVLLLIAFGTMLGVDQYSYKNKNLSSLLIMAVLVNFTRTICGVLIDFGQVVMLTFVYGFKEAAGGNFANGLHLTQLLSPSASALKDTLKAIGESDPLKFSLGIVISSVLAVIALAVSCGILIVLSLSLIARIVTLWLLIVLSPLAFFLRAVPTKAASGYYAEWWKKFTGQVVFGPIMAFVLWLALLVASGNQLDSGFTSSQSAAETFSAGVTQFGDFNQVKSFIVMIVLLAAGYKMSSQMAAESGGMAQKVAQKLKRGAVSLGKFAGGAAANAGILSAKDPVTGERQSLASMGRGYKQKLTESGFGRFIGMDKKFTEAREKKRDIANISDPAKRRAAVDRLAAEKAKENTKSTQENEKTIRDEKASKVDRQAAMLVNAERGADSMKNLGPEGKAKLLKDVMGIVRVEVKDENGNVKKDEEGKPILAYTEKDKDTVKQFDKALAAGGNQDAAFENADKAASWFRRAGPEKQLAALERKGEFQSTYLKNIDANQFEKYSDKDQQKILKMLEEAGGVENEKKIDELNRVATNPIERATVDQERNEKMLAKDPNATKLLADTEQLARAHEEDSGGASAGVDLDTVKKQAADLAKQYADMGGDGTGKIAEELAAVQSATSPIAAANRLASAAEGLAQAIQRGNLSPAERNAMNKAIERGRTSFGNAENEFGRSMAPLSPDEKFAAARKGANKTLTAIDTLESGPSGTLSEQAIAKLKVLKNNLRKITAMKNSSALDATMEKQIGELAAQIAEIKNSIE